MIIKYQRYVNSMRKPITDKQYPLLKREGITDELCRLLSSRSAGCLLTDIWYPPAKNEFDPVNNSDDDGLAFQLLDCGFEPELIVTLTRNTVYKILDDLPPDNPIAEVEELIAELVDDIIHGR